MTSEGQSHTLSECFVELIAYIFFLERTCARRQPTLEAVREQTDRLLEEGAQRMRKWRFDPRDFDEARFAVCAWADETLLNMPWMHRDKWRGALLQSRLYNTTNAGEEFFERLGSLREDQSGAREVYSICLSLGFRGRYHDDAEAFLLEQLKRANLKTLFGATRELSRYLDQPVFQGGAVTSGQIEKARAPARRRWGLGRLALLTAPPVLAVFLFVIYNFVLNGVVDNLIGRLSVG